jgi:nitroreductase
MPSVSTKTVTDALHWRYATKKFDPAGKIPADTWAALEEALLLAPSSYGLQPWRFIVVTDPATRAKLAAASWGQRQAIDSSHFVVFAARKGYDEKDLEHYVERTAEVRGITKESIQGYADVIASSLKRAREAGFLDAWMAKQVYIALGQFMTSAAILGVDTCPMEGIDPAKYDEVLGLAAKGYVTLCACAAGYRSAEDKYANSPKVRFKADEVILHV